MVVGDGFGRSGSERPLAGQVEGLHWPCLSLDTVFKRGLQYRFDLLIDLRFTAMEVRTCHSSKGTRCSGCLQCFRHFITPHKVLKTTLCLEIIMPILQMKVRFREVK